MAEKKEITKVDIPLKIGDSAVCRTVRWLDGRLQSDAFQ